MKKQILIFVALFATLFSFLTASAQGEWKWAHYWSGLDESFSAGIYHNNITNTAFDEDGNIYVYGTMGGTPVFDGVNFQFVNNAQVLNCNNRSILLAKYDTFGNMLWYKVVKSSVEMAFPLWMEIRDNKVCFAGNCGFYGEYSDDWLYYLDTLVYKYQLNSIPEEQQELPFKAYHRWTFFAQLDLDGNLLEDHFVETYSRDSFFNGIDSIRHNANLCMNTICPIHIGDDENVYVFTPIQYQGNESQPYTIVVDGDSSKTYNLYLPGSVEAPYNINNAFLYKFTSDWNLDFAKLLIVGTDGIAPYGELQTGDHIQYHFYTQFEGLSFDENDNMYVTGRFQLGQYLPGLGGELNQYPVHLWWDSTHCATINDMSSAEYCNFIVKYNTEGTLLWNNQIYTTINNINNGWARAIWYRSAISDNSIFILGSASYNENGLVFFDMGQPLEQFQGIHSSTCFIAKYDAITGEYILHSIVPAVKTTSSKTPAVLNNRVFAMSQCENKRELCLSMWRNDGAFIQADTIIHSVNNIQMHHAHGVSANNSGHFLAALLATSPVTFGDNLHVNCPLNYSSAVFALFNNPIYAQPYVGLPTYSKNESDMHFWPNPAQNVLNIESELSVMSSVSVLDMNGKTILQKNAGDNQTSIDVSMLPAGFYFLKVVCEKDVFVEKFIKSTY